MVQPYERTWAAAATCPAARRRGCMNDIGLEVAHRVLEDKRAHDVVHLVTDCDELLVPWGVQVREQRNQRAAAGVNVDFDELLEE